LPPKGGEFLLLRIIWGILHFYTNLTIGQKRQIYQVIHENERKRAKNLGGGHYFRLNRPKSPKMEVAKVWEFRYNLFMISREMIIRMKGERNESVKLF